MLLGYTVGELADVPGGGVLDDIQRRKKKGGGVLVGVGKE